MRYEIIAIGVSAGGFDALCRILPELNADIPLPVVVVQHMSADSDNYLVQRLDELSVVSVKEAEDKEFFEPGVVYVAPPDYHLLANLDGSVSLSCDERVNYSRPSIDVLFESIVGVYQDKTVGVILTGANSDGAKGLQQITDNGGLGIVQSPDSAYADAMPKAAIQAADVDFIVPLEKMGRLLNKIAMGCKDE